MTSRILEELPNGGGLCDAPDYAISAESNSSKLISSRGSHRAIFTEGAYSRPYAELSARVPVLWGILEKNFRENPLRGEYLEVTPGNQLLGISCAPED